MMITEEAINPEEKMISQEETPTKDSTIEDPGEISKKKKDKKETTNLELTGLKSVKSNQEMMN